MSSLNEKVKNLRLISFLLFLLPTAGLILSLLFHNLLVSSMFKPALYSVKSNSNEIVNFYHPKNLDCNEDNNFCKDIYFKNYKNIEDCNKSVHDINIYVGSNKYLYVDYLNKIKENLEKFKNEKIKLVVEKTDKFNHRCIKNFNLYFQIYKYFPPLINFTQNVRKGDRFQPGTAGPVNPFIYGEASISNIVKRYPVDRVFKPIFYLSSILMIMYWLSYNAVFKEILNQKKYYNFTIFGILSGIFLLFHVYFLGSKIEGDIFQSIRKLILLLFMIFEIMAQFFLTKRLYNSINHLKNYTHIFVIKLKVVFISIILIVTTLILVILSFYNLDSKVDYILEWNYFVFLIFFYLLSFLMWKKVNL
tara:strand:- start:1913 stop:2995 length:1083 start_codon:yes stop_codon:yes gene_type:complete